MPNQRKQQPDAEPSKDGISLYEAQRRRTLALAKQEELKTQLLEGTLVEVQEVLNVWQHVAAAIRAKLLGLPTKAAPLCMGQRSVQAVRGILDGQIRETLDELTRLRLEPVRPAAPSQRERVGRRVPATES